MKVSQTPLCPVAYGWNRPFSFLPLPDLVVLSTRPSPTLPAQALVHRTLCSSETRFLLGVHLRAPLFRNDVHTVFKHPCIPPSIAERREERSGRIRFGALIDAPARHTVGFN